MKPDYSLVQKAEQLVISGQFTKAQDLLMEALGKDPNNPEAYYLLGDVLCKLKRFKDAITVLQKADNLFPKHPRIYHLLGWAIFMDGDIPAGRAFMEVALKVMPDEIQLFTDLAVLEMRAGNFEKAQDYITRGKKLAPTDEILAEVEMVVKKIKNLSERAKNKPN